MRLRCSQTIAALLARLKSLVLRRIATFRHSSLHSLPLTVRDTKLFWHTVHSRLSSLAFCSAAASRHSVEHTALLCGCGTNVLEHTVHSRWRCLVLRTAATFRHSGLQSLPLLVRGTNILEHTAHSRLLSSGSPWFSPYQGLDLTKASRRSIEMPAMLHTISRCGLCSGNSSHRRASRTSSFPQKPSASWVAWLKT